MATYIIFTKLIFFDKVLFVHGILVMGKLYRGSVVSEFVALTEKELDWLAKEIKKPIIIHSRDAAKDTLDIIKETNAKEVGGVVHCFSYGVDMAREYLNMGYYIGVGGVVTFKNGKKLKEVVKYAPLDRILLETDCPYLAPVPFRGKRNDSTLLSYVVSEIASIKGVSTEEVKKVTMDNALKMYGIDKL